MFEGLVFKVADPAERERALALRRRIYSAELGTEGIDEYDERADHLIACGESGELIAAVRVVRPDDRPFECERYVDLGDFLPENRRPAEASRFCVDPAHRLLNQDNVVQIGILKILVWFAESQEATDVVTLVMPHLKNFYRVVFFQRLGDPIRHAVFGTAHFLRLDLGELRERGGRRGNSLARLLLEPDLPNFRLELP